MTKPRPIQARRYIAEIGVFCVSTVMLSAGIAFAGIPEQISIGLLAPIVLAAMLRPRYVYLSMLAFHSLCVVVATENYLLPITESTITVAAVVLSTFLACEGLQYVARQRKRAIAAMQESETRLRTFIENAADAIFVLDADGAVVDFNDAACRLLNIARGQLVGRGFQDICPGIVSGNRVDRHADVKLPATWEGNLIPMNGAPLPVEVRTGSFVMSKAPHHVAIVRDVSERVESEAKLSRAEAIRNSILESTPDHVMMVGLDYHFQFINRTVPELTVGDVVSHSILEFIPERFHQSVRDCFSRVIDTGQPDAYEVEYEARDGAISLFESRVAPVVHENRVTALVISATDVTQRRQQERDRLELERQLLHTQKLESLGLLAGGIAHDFNNLLVAILGNAELANLNADATPNVCNHIQNIIDASKHAAELCGQLLAYSGKGRVLVGPVDLSAVVLEMRRLVKVSNVHNARVEFELTEKLSAVEADVSQLKQIVLNLVNNALEALKPSGGIVYVRTGTADYDRTALLGYLNGDAMRNGKCVYLEVQDDGTGVEPAAMEKIFDPFFTTKAEGRGLGLAAVLGVVRAHGGAINVTSEPGIGTTFRVLLPASDRPAQPRSNGSADLALRDWKGFGLILVVDDEPQIRDVAKMILQTANYDVITAENGFDAVESLKANLETVRAVLLDMKMPGMNGEQTMQAMRAIRPGLPILLSSGFSDVEIQERATEQGAAGFLPKPYEVRDLLASIERILQ